MDRLLDIITSAKLVDNETVPTEEVGIFKLNLKDCPQGVPDCILERFPQTPKIPDGELSEVTFYAYWTKDGKLASYELDRAYVCCGIRSNDTRMLGNILKDFPETRARLHEMARSR